MFSRGLNRFPAPRNTFTLEMIFRSLVRHDVLPPHGEGAAVQTHHAAERVVGGVIGEDHLFIEATAALRVDAVVHEVERRDGLCAARYAFTCHVIDANRPGCANRWLTPKIRAVVRPLQFMLVPGGPRWAQSKSGEMARRSHRFGVLVGIIGLGACSGVVTRSDPDRSKGGAGSVAMSAGASAVHVGSSGASSGFSGSTNGADYGGASAAGEGALGGAGGSLISGGGTSTGSGSSSPGGGSFSSSGGSFSAGGAAEVSSSGGEAGELAVEPQLSDCMASDIRECTYCSAASGATPKVIMGDVRLTTQSQVEALRGVVEITGNLTLQGDVSLRSLHALCCLEKVGGSVVIQWMYNLGNVDGLSSLTQVGGNLLVTGSNCSNVNLKGLGSVQSVGGDFEVEKDECYLLTRIGSQNIAGHITRRSTEACP